MLHLIPAPLHRAALRIAYRLRAVLRRHLQLHTRGVSLIGRDEHQRILLVRHGYGSGRWALPGGGRRRWEQPESCIRREMREELGCELIDLALVEKVESVLDGAPNTSHIFTSRFATPPQIDGREIVAADWFAPDTLPPDMVWIARMQLQRVLGT